MAETFGVVSGAVWRSKRVRQLSEFEKLVYLYLHINPHRNSLGLYSLPVVFAADDIDVPPPRITKALARIIAVGLADYDAEESFVRVANWEFKNAPDGPQMAIGRVYQFDKQPVHRFTYAAYLCFMREVIKRANRNQWSDEKGFKTKLEELLHRRAEQWFFDAPQEVMDGFALAGIDPHEAVFARLWESISYRDNIPTQYPMDTKTQTESESKTQTESESKNNARGTNGPRPSRAASPAKKGSRPGRKQTIDEIQDSLTKE